MESKHTIPLQQAKALHARVLALNVAQSDAQSYFTPIIDGLGLPAATTFTSIDQETGTLVVHTPDEPKADG